MYPAWKFSETNSNSYFYDPPTDESVSSTPLIRDFLEEMWVEAHPR